MKRSTRQVVGWVIATLGGWGVAVVLVLCLLLFVIFGAVLSAGDNALPFSSAAAVEPIPPQLVPLYHAAGARYRVPWAILAGINRVETNFGHDLSVSSAGAIGWMQFEPATWAEYRVDADGDGNADPYDPVDAIFTAAHDLAASGVAKNPAQAVFAYNHSTDYVREVLRLAHIYQAWNPLSATWVWPVAQARNPVSAAAQTHGEGPSVVISANPGVIVRAMHGGTVTAVTNNAVTLDPSDGLTVLEQGLRPSVSRGQRVVAGEWLGTAATQGVTASIEEQGALLPVLWFVSPSMPALAPTPPLVQRPLARRAQ